MYCLEMLRVIPGALSHFRASATRLPHRIDFHGTVPDLKLFLNPLGIWVVGGK